MSHKVLYRSVVYLVSSHVSVALISVLRSLQLTLGYAKVMVIFMPKILVFVMDFGSDGGVVIFEKQENCSSSA